MPLFTILMAVYNAEAYLPQAIDSVLAQTEGRWELLCVDDSSTDNSLAILQGYAQKDSRIHVLQSTTNQGPAKCRNMALSHAKGQYIGMLDADDWLDSDALEKILECFLRNNETDSVLFTLQYEYPDSSSKPYKMNYLPGDTFTGKEAFTLSLDWRLHGLYFTTKEIHLRYPYDDSCRLHSDDNTTRMHYLHSRRVTISSATYHYRQIPHSISYAVNMGHFDYIRANLSMKDTLQKEHLANPQLVTDSDLLCYERHRWLNYVGMHWFLFLHRKAFNKSQQHDISTLLQDTYKTFNNSAGFMRLGYVKMRSYRLFLLQEKLYFLLRYLIGYRQ